MNTRDFSVAVNKFFFYINNYECTMVTYSKFGERKSAMLPEFFKAFDESLIAHLYEKFDYYYKKYGSNRAVMELYGELDGSNRYKLLKWINENYTPRNEEHGISIPSKE